MTLFPARINCVCSLHTSTSTKFSLLGRVLLLVGTFAGLEFVVGSMSHSLSLQADSGHMLSDGLALAIALFAAWMARHSTGLRKNHAFSQQVETWAALANGVGLLGMAGLIAWEAYGHWHAPPTEILSVPMLITAIIGLGINGISLKWLQTFQEEEQAQANQPADLNLQGASLHVFADVLGSVGVILAAIAVWMWGWTWADDVISVGLSLLIGGSAIPLLYKSLKQLREPKSAQAPALTSPPPLDPRDSELPLNTWGFCEIGQTDLSQIISDQPTLGAQAPRSENAHNQP